MGNCQVLTVGKDRKLQKQFVRLAWDIYRNDPNWVPPLMMALEEGVNFVRILFMTIMSARNFLAVRDGKPLDASAPW